MEQRKTFNFNENKVEILELEELKRTYKENDTFGNPLRGKYHYEIIEEVGNIISDLGLNMEIQEIFAAQNKDRQNPGVVINPAIEERYGKDAIEAHVLRRIYANIRVNNFDNDELTTNVAVAFHQNAIQLAYGPMVKICHNQCILSPARVFTTNRQTDINGVIAQFAAAMQHFAEHIEQDKETIARMKMFPMTPQMILQTIGIFEAAAVKYYSKDERIKNRDIYPLNLSQVSRFTEDMMIKSHELNNNVSLWDVYNVCTNLYKADTMEIPSMFNQHLALNRITEEIMQYR